MKKGEDEKEQHCISDRNCIYHGIELRVDLALEGNGWDRGCEERSSESMGIARGGLGNHYYLLKLLSAVSMCCFDRLSCITPIDR